MHDGNYINLRMDGDYAKLSELRTRDEFIKSGTDDALEGAELPFDEEKND
jgi:hypothetical protein